MRNAQQRRVSLREQGKRRVRHLTQALAVAGGALAALFGVVFAKDASAVAPTTASPATGSTQSTSPPPMSPPPTTVAPTTPDTDTQTITPAPSILQPPAQAPQPVFGGGGQVRTRSTP